MSEEEKVPVEIRVEEEIQEEIKRLRAEQIDWDDRAQDLQDAHNKAEALLESDQTPEHQQECERLYNALMRAINAGTAISERLTNLRSPGEIERRVEQRLATNKRIGALREGSAKMAKETAKDQGVPDVYLNDKGNFKIGMDARLKSDLVNAALEIPSEAALHQFNPTEATGLLNKRGWTSFLDRKREIVAEKARKSEESAAKRDAAAREKAEAKEVKAREREEAKAAKAAEREAAKTAAASAKQESGSDKSEGVTPDPKPANTKRSRAKTTA